MWKCTNPINQQVLGVTHCPQWSSKDDRISVVAAGTSSIVNYLILFSFQQSFCNLIYTFYIFLLYRCYYYYYASKYMFMFICSIVMHVIVICWLLLRDFLFYKHMSSVYSEILCLWVCGLPCIDCTFIVIIFGFVWIKSYFYYDFNSVIHKIWKLAK